MNEKKLRLANKDKVLGGVCGGVAEYVSIDSTVIRLAWILIGLLSGASIFIVLAFYFFCWALIPSSNYN